MAPDACVVHTTRKRSCTMLIGRRLAQPRRIARFAPMLRQCSSSSIDDNLKAVLAQAALAIQQKDPLSRPLDGGAIQGATRTGGPKMVLRFTCTHEGPEAPTDADTSRTSTKIISKGSYEKGASLLLLFWHLLLAALVTTRPTLAYAENPARVCCSSQALLSCGATAATSST